MSGAMTRYPASERALIWYLHEYQDSGNPWHKRTKGPAPASAIWILMPFDSTNLCSANIANLAVIYFGKNATSNFEPSDLGLKNNTISVLISIWDDWQDR